jgi:hypothetical protein
VAETIDWAGAGHARPQRLDERRRSTATLGTVLKYREDQERVRSHGVGDLVRAAVPAGT